MSNSNLMLMSRNSDSVQKSVSSIALQAIYILREMKYPSLDEVTCDGLWIPANDMLRSIMPTTHEMSNPVQEKGI